MCHKKATNSGAPTGVTVANTQAAIAKAAGTALCTDCHKTVTKTAPHVQRAGDGGTPGTQFPDSWSGHKVYSSSLGSGLSFANIQGATRTWPLPTATWLSNGWTTISMVTCSDCHGSFTGATGPHGSSMQVNYAIDSTTGKPYDKTYTSGALSLSNGSMSNKSNLCFKCHPQNLGVNGEPHGQQNHNVACTSCHVKIPHAWKRPRLIGYTSDPAPYASTQVNSMRAKSYNPNSNSSWTKTDCGAGCATGTHPAITGTSLWP
jgi:5-methylcytosine-specific restriction endonuclease McrA